MRPRALLAPQSLPSAVRDFAAIDAKPRRTAECVEEREQAAYHPRVAFPQTRLRRLRRTPVLRDLVRETRAGRRATSSCRCSSRPASSGREPIAAMPGVDRLSISPGRRRGGRGRGARHARRAAVRHPGRQGRGGLGRVGRRGRRPARDARDQGRPPGPARHRRPLPVRVHEPRPLRRCCAPTAASTTTPRVELLARTAVSHARAGADVDRAERHDGRARRRDPRRARRRGPDRHADHRLQREVRLRLLRPVPRGRRLDARRRATAAATRWTPPTATRRCARRCSTSRRAPTS